VERYEIILQEDEKHYEGSTKEFKKKNCGVSGEKLWSKWRKIEENKRLIFIQQWGGGWKEKLM
jgi:hypothetical protein